MPEVISIEIEAQNAKAVKSLSEVEEKLKDIAKEEEKLKKLISETKDTEKVKKYREQLEKLKKTQTTFVNRQKEIKESNDLAFEKLDNLLGGLPGKFKNAAGALKTLKTGFGNLRAAVAATGIGALVIAVTAAVEWFANFESGVKLAEKAMNTFGAVVGQLGAAFNALLDGNFGEAGNAIKDIGSAGQEAARQTDLLFEAQERLFEIQKNNIVENENLRQELELQKRILEDTTLGTEERLAALEKVRDISIEIQENVIAETEAMKAETEAMLANENNYEKRRELQLKLSQIQADLIKQNGELALIEKDAQKVEREIYTLQREKKNQQLEEELRIKRELLQAEKERDAATRIATTGVVKSINIEEQGVRKLAGTKMQVAESEKQQVFAIQEIKKVAQSEEAQFALSMLSNVASALNEGSEGQKAIQIAQAGIQTTTGAINAFTAAQVIPPPAGQILGAINAAAVTAAGLKQIATIRNTKIPKIPRPDGGSSSGGISAGSAQVGSGFQASTPTISAIPQFTNTTTGNAQTGVRAYVIQNDITNQQALAKRLDQRATL